MRRGAASSRSEGAVAVQPDGNGAKAACCRVPAPQRKTASLASKRQSSRGARVRQSGGGAQGTQHSRSARPGPLFRPRGQWPPVQAHRCTNGRCRSGSQGRRGRPHARGESACFSGCLSASLRQPQRSAPSPCPHVCCSFASVETVWARGWGAAGFERPGHPADSSPRDPAGSALPAVVSGRARGRRNRVCDALTRRRSRNHREWHAES